MESEHSTERVVDRWWLVVAAGVALFMGQLDSTIVTVALPTLETEFDTTTEVIQWVVLGFVLPLIGLALPAGRWLDTVGPRSALTFSVTGFAVASCLVGMSPSIGWLITARVVQGLFGAIMLTLVPVLATVAVSPAARGRAMAIVMTLGPLGGVSGPVLGGVAIETIGWRWVFFANLPVSLAVVAIGWVLLSRGSRLRSPDRNLILQAVLLGGAVAGVLVGLTLGVRQPAWLGVALLAVPLTLAWLRMDASLPVVEHLSEPRLRGAHVALLAEMSAIAAVQFVIPFYLIRDAGVSSAHTGLILLATPLTMILTAGLAGAAVDRGDARRVARTGAWTVTFACALAAASAAYGAPLAVAGSLCFLGLGAALFAGPNQNVAMSASPAERLSTTAATTSLARQLGVAAGPATATTVWTLSGNTDQGLLLALSLAVPLGLLSVYALRTPGRWSPTTTVRPDRRACKESK